MPSAEAVAGRAAARAARYRNHPLPHACAKH